LLGVARHGDALPVARALISQVGSPARLALPGQDIVIITSAEDAHHVLFAQQDRYPKGEEYDVPGLALRSGLVTSRGEEWRRDRSILNPLFTKRHLRPLAETMADSAAALVGRWDAEHTGAAGLDVAHEMMAVTLEIAACTLFGAALSDEDTELFGAGITTILADLITVGSSPLTWVGRCGWSYTAPACTRSRCTPAGSERPSPAQDGSARSCWGVTPSPSTVMSRPWREPHRRTRRGSSTRASRTDRPGSSSGSTPAPHTHSRTSCRRAGSNSSVRLFESHRESWR
jgi:hypothetical protein